MRRGIWLALGFGAVGLGVTLWLLGESLTSLGRVPAWGFAAGALCVAANYAAGGARLTLLTRLAGQPLPYLSNVRAYALGLFSAAITPGSAGQAPAVALALVRDGYTGVAAWSVNVYVWVLDLAFLAYSVPLSLLLIGRSSISLSTGQLWAFAIVASVAAAFMMWVLTFRLHWITRLGRRLFRLRWLRRWRKSAWLFFDRVEAASGEIMQGSLRERALLHALTAAVYLSTLVAFWVMVVSVRPGTPLPLTLAVAQLPTVLATFMPTPGGAGLLEVLTASLFIAGTQDARVSGAGRGVGGTVAAAILGWRLLTYYSRFVIGPVVGATFAKATNGDGAERDEEAEAGRA